MKVTVLGAGAWGTAAAQILHLNHHRVTLWGHNPAHLDEIRATRRNEHYLPGIDLPSDWVLSNDWTTALRDADLVVVGVPSRAVRTVCSPLAEFKGVIVSLTKGIEDDTGLTMCGLLARLAPHAQVAALSGPTFAIEVAKGAPTAIVAASRTPETAQFVQSAFHRKTFRVYTSIDLLGVELGGAVKNVIAIAAGVCDGLGFGDNSKAGLVTRAIAEIRRLGVACGAEAETFAGLSGLGDLMLTCFSRLSRNRAFGERLGKGEPLSQVLQNARPLVEGYPTTRSAFHLAERHKVDTPIINEVYAMLYDNKNLVQALQDLIGRDSKAED